MPFLSEKLWHNLYDNKKFLMMEKYSEIQLDKTFNNSKEKMQIIIDIITAIRNVRSELNISYKHNIEIICLKSKNKKLLRDNNLIVIRN